MRIAALVFGAALVGCSSVFAAELKPRVLDVTVGARGVRLSVLENGQRVHADWKDEADRAASAAFDATSGAVIRRSESSSSKHFVALNAGGVGRDPETQIAIEVMIEAAAADTEFKGPTRLIETATGRALADLLPGETALVATRAASGLVVVTGGQDIQPSAAKPSFTLRFWEQGKSAPRWVFDVPTARGGGEFASATVAISDDGTWVTAVRDGTLHLIDAASGGARLVSRSGVVKAADGTGGVIGVGFARDGAALYVSDGGVDVMVKRLTDLADIRRIKTPPEYRVRHVTEHAGGKILELAGRRQTVFLDTASGKFLRRDRGSSTNSYILAWLGDGRVLSAFRARRDPVTFRIYTHTAGAFVSKTDRTWPGGNLAALAWSPNGRCLMLSGGGKTAVLGTDTLQEIATLAVVGDRFETATYARRGGALVAVDEQRRVLMYDMPARCHDTG